MEENFILILSTIPSYNTSNQPLFFFFFQTNQSFIQNSTIFPIVDAALSSNESFERFQRGGRGRRFASPNVLPPRFEIASRYIPWGRFPEDLKGVAVAPEIRQFKHGSRLPCRVRTRSLGHERDPRLG